ncbi:MAG: rhodanese-like domain-containing protein [Hyphomicrobiaceae bacterium]
MSRTSVHDLVPDHVHPQEAHRLMRDVGLVLVDIRTPSEWMRTGIAEGAVPLTPTGPHFADEIASLLGGDKSRPVGLICGSGARSAQAQRFLAANGFTQVTNVVEGMTGAGGAGPGWILRGLPTVPYHHR